MPDIEKIRDKFIFEDQPKRDIDFIEWSLPPEKIDKVVNERAMNQIRNPETDLDFLRERYRKQQKQRENIFKAAAICLTDIQFKFFMHRYKGNYKVREIAKKFKVLQPYVSIVLHASREKIKRFLGEPSKMKDRKFYQKRKKTDKRHRFRGHNNKKRHRIKRKYPPKKKRYFRSIRNKRKKRNRRTRKRSLK